MNKKAILIVAVLSILVVGIFYGIYQYYNGDTIASAQKNNTTDQIDPSINSDDTNNATEQDITIEASADNSSEAIVTVIPANSAPPQQMDDNYTDEGNVTYDIQTNNSTDVQTTPTATLNSEATLVADTQMSVLAPQSESFATAAPQCESSASSDDITNTTINTTTDTTNCTNTTDCTNTTSNSTLIYPTYDQLISFLDNDNTDMNSLSDNQAAVSLAKAAIQANYHNQIVLLVFNNSQVYMVNRFMLTDGSFAYVDDAAAPGVSNDGTYQMDRLLTIYSGQTIIARSPYNDNVKYIYPATIVENCIPFWKI
jgi:hypothetical protein